jgi:DNA-binding PadR family transcriptional regulator
MRPSSTSGFDLPAFDLRGAIDDLRTTFGSRMTNAGARHDIRSAILTELATAPMHGYQLIQAIQERSHGAWTPTPGSVYPELQLLADEGLATSAQDGERKVYTLTAAGIAAAAAVADDTDDADAAPRGASHRPWDSERAALPKAGAKLAQAVGQVGMNASTEQQERAVAIIDEARKKLYAILAED